MICVAKGGMSWIIGSFAFVFLFLVISFFTTGPLLTLFLVLSLLFFFVSLLLVIFFRDPDRRIGPGVVAVADGRIREILPLKDPDIGDCIRVSTFMNIHNVHVNRMPFDGTIEKIIHHPGGHLPAFQKESEANERVVLLIKTDIGMMKIVQIAGTLARRIVPYVKEHDRLLKGGKIGLIRLGSRVDVYLPTNRINAPRIQVHDRIKAGEDTIAETHD
ncbi:MAG: phosphatidylserine decarboxylase [Candidatus Thermoplasmatota archaeon]|nr:phosphatidylserine decarboxylase [Candidatus Thermoplasmatota archaeon]